MSGAAIASIILATIGSMCLGPIGSVAAVVVGIIALVDIRDSHGTKSGTAAAIVSVSVGALTTVAYGAVVLLMLTTAAKLSRIGPHAGRPPVHVAPPTSSPSGTTMPRATNLREGSISKDTTTTESVVGSIRVVDVGSSAQSLDKELRAQRAAVAKSGERLVLETTSARCRPCLGLAAALSDPLMQKALGGVRLVRIDVAEFTEDLIDMGIPHDAIPGFFVLGADMRPTDGVTGAEWDDDTASNIAPVLSGFLKGTYTRRRQPWTPTRRPNPRDTVL